MLRRNILIFHNAALGDFLMTWPLALALGRVFAQSRVMFVTSSQKGTLAEKAIGLEFRDADAGWHALHGDGLTLPETATRVLNGLQLAIVFAVEDDKKFEQRLREIAGECTVLWINPKPPAGVHMLAHQRDELRMAPMLQQGVEQMQHLIETRGLQAPAGDSVRVVIHPGSGAARKNWPIEAFEKLAILLRAKGFDVIFIIGEVEHERLSKDAIERLSSVAAVKSCDTLVDLYDTIASAGTFIGNDSGPTHLAAMLARKTIALFGPASDAIAWRPVGRDVKIVGFEATPEDVAEFVCAAQLSAAVSE